MLRGLIEQYHHLRAFRDIFTVAKKRYTTHINRHQFCRRYFGPVHHISRNVTGSHYRIPDQLRQMALCLNLAAAAGVWERFHIRIEILELRFTEANRRRLRIGIHALVAVMGLVLLVYGAMLAWDVRVHVIPSLGISRAWAYVVIPFAGLLISLFSLARIRVRMSERGANSWK